ncbi:MAG: response regulator [Pseudomonadota bacterium]
MNSSLPAYEDEARVPRILVVDDMPDNLFLMQGLFEDRFEVVQAQSGREALQIVMGSNPPDMVLLDIMMPDMDGYEVLRRIRQHTPTAHIPVIFLTALAGQQDQALGLKMGAVDYLTKPVDPELVLSRVETRVRESTHARRVEALSEKLARHLPPNDWQRLFQGEGQHAIRFEQKRQTVLYAEIANPGTLTPYERENFSAEVEWLAARHMGTVDRYVDCAAVVFFSDPAACIRMAMDVHRNAGQLRLRMGIHTGLCEIGTFRNDFLGSCTLIGGETHLAARVAASAAIGSISVSPETYVTVRDCIADEAAGCLLTEEFNDTDLAQICLTPAPVRGGEHALSSFAGLGLLG